MNKDNQQVNQISKIMKYNCKDIYDNPENYNELLYQSGYLIYLITNEINNKHYVGDTTINLHYRLFFDKHWKGHFIRYRESILNPSDSHGHLYNSMRKYGLENFSIEILYQGDYDEHLEGYYIGLYDSFYNGYNGSLSGKSFNKESNVSGKLRISNGEIEKWIKPGELDYWMGLGFYVGNKPGHGFEGVHKYLDSIPGLRSELTKKAYRTSANNNGGIHPMTVAASHQDIVSKRQESNKTNHGGVLAWNTRESIETSRKSLESRYGHRNGACSLPEVRKKATEKYVFTKEGNYYVMSKNAHGYKINGYTRLCSLEQWDEYCKSNNIINTITSDQCND